MKLTRGNPIEATSVSGGETIKFLSHGDAVAAGFNRTTLLKHLNKGTEYKGYTWRSL